jgi:6-phosphogluconolactonase
MQFWLGGYGPGSEGNASGIGVLLAGAADDGSAGGQLRFAGDAATVAASPSWLAAHPTLDVVYAALERSNTVQAFRRTGEASLVPLGAPGGSCE